MTLRIIGDIVELDHRPVGFITVPSGTMRDRLVELLDDTGGEQIEHLESQLNHEVDLHEETRGELEEAERIIATALRYAEDEENPQWQKLIEILS